MAEKPWRRWETPNPLFTPPPFREIVWGMLEIEIIVFGLETVLVLAIGGSSAT